MNIKYLMAVKVAENSKLTAKYPRLAALGKEIKATRMTKTNYSNLLVGV
jgi:hypothetical protein